MSKWFRAEPAKIWLFRMLGGQNLSIFFHENNLIKIYHASGSEPTHQDLSIAHIFVFFGVYFDIPPNFWV
jgi:hypothetical protein